MRAPQGESFFNELPPVVWLLAGPIIAGEILFGLGQSGIFGDQALGWRNEAFQRFAFAPNGFRYMLATGVWDWRDAARIVTYPFVHGSLTHAAMVLVFLLALGKMVGEVFRGWAVAAVFFAASIGGALIYGLLPFTRVALFGGYPPAYGLIGAFTWLLWMKLGSVGASRSRAFLLIGMLLLVRLVFGVFFGIGADWIADFSGFGIGFAISFFVAPGGWRNVLRHLRER